MQSFLVILVSADPFQNDISCKYHSVMVLQKNGNTLTVVEGNHNATVHWGRKITKKELQESGFYVETRY